MKTVLIFLVFLTLFRASEPNRGHHRSQRKFSGRGRTADSAVPVPAAVPVPGSIPSPSVKTASAPTDVSVPADASVPSGPVVPTNAVVPTASVPAVSVPTATVLTGASVPGGASVPAAVSVPTPSVPETAGTQKTPTGSSDQTPTFLCVDCTKKGPDVKLEMSDDENAKLDKEFESYMPLNAGGQGGEKPKSDKEFVAYMPSDAEQQKLVSALDDENSKLLGEYQSQFMF